MRIKSLELVRCKRLQLNHINRFVIRLHELVQLILGTNGSGKSSLIKLLTPLPPDANDFYKDGSKFIEIEHRGNDYALKSTFEPKTHHSFVKNGQEENPGGTIGAFLKLCAEEFQLTPEIHKLLMGEDSFTTMGPTKRREWFTKLSDISYDYALSVFSQLKDRSRDTTGALRMAKKRIVEETAKIMSVEEENKLRGEVDHTKLELQLLLRQSESGWSVNEVRNSQNEMLEDLNTMSRRLLRLKVAAPYGATDPYSIDPRLPVERDDWHQPLLPVFKSIEDIDSLVDSLRHQATSKETLINKAVQEHTKLTETVEILMRTGKEGIKSLQERMAGERIQRDEALAMRKLKIEGINPRLAIGALDSVIDVLTEVFGTIPSNEEKQFSRVRLQELQDKLAQLKANRASKLQHQGSLIAKKGHYESHKDAGALTCPKCTHSWRPGYDEMKVKQLSEQIDALQAEMNALDKQVEEVEEDVVKIQEYSNLYRDYMNCVRNWPVLQPFWNYLNDEELVVNAPRKALSVMNMFKADLEFERQAAVFEDAIEETKKLIESAEKVGDADLTESKQQLDDVTLQIEKMTGELTEVQGKVANYLRYRGQVLETQTLEGKIVHLTRNLEVANQDLIKAIRQETIAACIDKLSSILAVKQDALNVASQQRAIIQALENDIKRLTIEEEACKNLVRELSPTDGLIAEGLLGFIRKFTSQMNAMIRKIWSYPLKVMDCGTVGEATAELDYKFPMLVNSENNIVGDVKDGSSGQREIINLAFKVTAMMYLGLQESPLYLDEFGASFDEAHRTSAMHAIKSIMDQKPFTQLFMVSHYESSYGAFTNSEICVLCPSNITTPAESKYNQHVTIE